MKGGRRLITIHKVLGESCAHKIVSVITPCRPLRLGRAVSKGVQHETYFPVPWTRIYITGFG